MIFNRHTPSPLICPVCSDALAEGGKGLRCENGHSFDFAKEGYINLLLSHQRRSSHPGDDANMIQARRRFFDSGAFDSITELIRQSAVNLPHSTLLDCGCGEGHLSGTLSEKGSVRVFGLDISKDAVLCAAKRYKNATWMVANVMRRLPLADHSMDVILSVLAPRNPIEFARVLKPGGTLLLGLPGPNHLIELRSRLAANAGHFQEKADEAAAKCAPFFTEKNRETLTYERILNPVQIADLIRMTPIFWCSGPEAKKTVQQLDQLTVTVSFVLSQFIPAAKAAEQQPKFVDSSIEESTTKRSE